jgi:hypothetical protein
MLTRHQRMRFGILAILSTVALGPVAALADPAITGFSADQVPLQSFVRIYGSGLGSAQGESYVMVGTRFVPVLAWADDAILILVNPLAYNQAPLALDAAYPVQVVIPSTGKSSNTLNLTITSQPPAVYTPDVVDQQKLSDQPVVVRFQKATFCAGDDIAILGSGFGFTQGTGYVSITVPFLDSQGDTITHEYAIPVLNWSEYSIDALLFLPTGAQLGDYTVTVHRGNGKTASAHFLIAACSS